ncbi:OLC1v1008555C1 [Oldenlandia corymbosa var. corymbosa]|uniref:OLC1v1008555C1 n=1 Tax=Oldenlandia corymbosa var. corymbosa TaxID=529605 RepID=A0AAV1DPA8_OLDCO|nr:OLC1v1008555C1 [Oldenlandia corymbosa var. corymbosa]
MQRSPSHSLLQFFQESDIESEVKNLGRRARKDRYHDKEDYSDEFVGEDSHLKNNKGKEPIKRRVDSSWGKHGLWNHEQKARAAKLEKQLKARLALEEMIEEQLNSFQAHYNSIMVPSSFKDVADLLMPKGTSAMELAALTWLGDWRPSSILNLLGSLISSNSESNVVGQVLPQLIKDVRVEEAVIDEEMAEIQANCVLHLPFGPIQREENDSSLLSVKEEFRKIHAVLNKAQNLRLRALELVAKKVMSQTDAAAFLVAFSAIQDFIHQFITTHRLDKGFDSQPLKSAPALESLRGGRFLTTTRTKTCEGKKYKRILNGQQIG